MAVQIYDVPADVSTRLTKRFERKYYLGPSELGLAYGLLRQVCFTDIEYSSEQINSLYFDTADLEQYERSASGDFLKDKVRLRWYSGKEDLEGRVDIFIELKSREGFAGMKQRLRLQVAAEDLRAERLSRGIVPQNVLLDTLARFGYFPRGRLQPVVSISYWRYRFSEMMTGQRVSLDYRIRSTMVMPGWGNGEKGLELPGGVIEIKGQSMELPPTLMRVKILHTDWTRFSKYAACLDAHLERLGALGRLSPSGRMVDARS